MWEVICVLCWRSTLWSDDKTVNLCTCSYTASCQSNWQFYNPLNGSVYSQTQPRICVGLTVLVKVYRKLPNFPFFRYIQMAFLTMIITSLFTSLAFYSHNYHSSFPQHKLYRKALLMICIKTVKHAKGGRFWYLNVCIAFVWIQWKWLPKWWCVFTMC